jgi:two-component system KDP operon response regulator KdpE
MTKPFGVNELIARVRALLRRAEGFNEAGELSRFGEVEVDRDARIVRRNGSLVHLTPTEFSLLTTLLSKPGAVWRHEQLLAAVWGSVSGVSNETLRVHMGSLRRKLEADPHRPHFILTEPWVGYRFSPE